MNSFEDFDPDRDLKTERYIHLNDKSKVTVRKDDVYGFWSLHLEKGRLPDKWRGKYTSYQAAKKDLELLLKQKLKYIVQEEM